MFERFNARDTRCVTKGELNVSEKICAFSRTNLDECPLRMLHIGRMLNIVTELLKP